LLAGVRKPELSLLKLIGRFKCFTTHLYWKRSYEIVSSGCVELPSRFVVRSGIEESRLVMSALTQYSANLRPEVVELKNWPAVKPEHFLKKHLGQTRFFDHVIRNHQDLEENLKYIAMNPVRAGYVSQPWFYPYTGFCREGS